MTRVYCTECGNDMISGDKFCSSCGHKVNQKSFNITESTLLSGFSDGTKVGLKLKDLYDSYTEPTSDFHTLASNGVRRGLLARNIFILGDGFVESERELVISILNELIFIGYILYLADEIAMKEGLEPASYDGDIMEIYKGVIEDDFITLPFGPGIIAANTITESIKSNMPQVHTETSTYIEEYLYWYIQAGYRLGVIETANFR